jgi:hypothetical protein
VSAQLAKRFGFNEVPWFKLTVLVLGIYVFLTMLVCMFRTDFVNLTICGAAIYMMANVDQVKRYTFRYLVWAILFSWVYDMFWLYIFSSDWKSDLAYDGGAEKGMRKFTLFFSYVSFFFRVSWIDFRFSLCLCFGKILWTSAKLLKPKKQRKANKQ